MQPPNTNTDILIAGAGPTGLGLAAELTRRGTSQLIIDKQPAGANTSRACVVHARTMEVLEPLGVTYDLFAQGVKVPIFRVRVRVRVRDRDRSLITIDFSEIASPYPFTLAPEDRARPLRCAVQRISSQGRFQRRPCARYERYVRAGRADFPRLWNASTTTNMAVAFAGHLPPVRAALARALAELDTQ